MHSRIEKHRTEILTIAARHGIRDVRVFGFLPNEERSQRGNCMIREQHDAAVSHSPSRVLSLPRVA